MTMFLGKDVIEIDHKDRWMKIEKKGYGIEMDWRVLMRKEPYLGEIWDGDSMVLYDFEVKEIIKKLEKMIE